MCEPVFYPQRLLTALLCSLASTIFMAYQAFSYIIQFEEAYNIYTEKIDNHFSFFNRIYNMNFKVYEYYLEFMNKGFDYVKTSGLNITLNENDFSSLLSVINFVREQFLAISWALGISFL